jgi:hypothetical protein
MVLNQLRLHADYRKLPNEANPGCPTVSYTPPGEWNTRDMATPATSHRPSCASRDGCSTENDVPLFADP